MAINNPIRFLLGKVTFPRIVCVIGCLYQTVEVLQSWLSFETIIAFDDVFSNTNFAGWTVSFDYEYVIKNVCPHIRNHSNSTTREILACSKDYVYADYNFRSNRRKGFRPNSTTFDEKMIHFTFSNRDQRGNLLDRQQHEGLIFYLGKLSRENAYIKVHYFDSDFPCNAFHAAKRSVFWFYEEVKIKSLPPPYPTQCKRYDYATDQSQCGCFSRCMAGVVGNKGATAEWLKSRERKENTLIKNLNWLSPICQKECYQIDCEISYYNFLESFVSYAYGNIIVSNHRNMKFEFLPAFGILDVTLYIAGTLSLWVGVSVTSVLSKLNVERFYYEGPTAPQAWAPTYNKCKCGFFS